jgi:hypothetical protein
VIKITYEQITLKFALQIKKQQGIVCLKGVDIWCQYDRFEVAPLLSIHKYPQIVAVLKTVKGSSLAQQYLISLHGNTQTSSDNFNKLISGLFIRLNL